MEVIHSFIEIVLFVDLNQFVGIKRILGQHEQVLLSLDCL